MTAEPIRSAADPASSNTSTAVVSGRIRGRAFLLALLLGPICAFWSVNQIVDVIFSLMVPPVVLTMVVAVGNLIVRRVAPRQALTEGELIVFYAMQTVVCAISAEWMTFIQPYIAQYVLFKSADYRYDQIINPYTNAWFFVQSKDAAKYADYKIGGFSFTYFVSRLPLWWRFIGAWTLLVTLVCLAMLCINSLMRDAWTNREKLSFPIIQAPMAVVQVGAGRSRIWASRYFYVPFLLMFSIDIMNGLHFMYPSVPFINVRFIGDMKQWFQSPQLQSMGWTPIGIFPYMAVIGFFMPTDLLFSCIFFFFGRKLMQVITYSIGYTESAGVFGGGGLVPSAPYFSEQSWGAFLALFCSAAWIARGYLGEVWQQIVGRRPMDRRGVSPRIAFGLLIASLAALGALGVAIGIPLWMVFFETLLFLAFSIALTRMRAQIGAPSHEMAFMGPNQMLVDFVGTQSLSQSAVSRVVTIFFFYNRIHRSHPMPQQLEAMKMGESVKMNQRALFVAILVATVAGSVLGHLVFIYNGYRYGAPSNGEDTLDVVSQFTSKHQGPNIVAIAFVLAGFAFVALLDFIRFRMPGFPLHPVGYALAMNFGLDYFWFGLVIVWIIKLFVERYYGLKGHDKLHQVAIGIILAEFSAEAIWAAYAMYTRTATYSISINGRLAWDQ